MEGLYKEKKDEPRHCYRELAYASPDDVVFGLAPNPVSCGFEVKVGAGEVLPEIDFTLPVMPINHQTWPEVQRQYQEMTKGVLSRAQRLDCHALALEIEHLYEMTTEPQWGAELTKQVKSIMEKAYRQNGLRSALRVTVADVRQRDSPAKMRTGEGFRKVTEALEISAASGADILSIESTGGKEVFDEAIVKGDIPSILFSLGVLACRDVRFLWRHISEIALKHDVLPGGDSACAFANTAMQLAHQNYVPRVLAALVRAVSAVRTLCAFEEGAAGPGKDCAYENPVIKIITGLPIAMEGKSAACAHSSPVGNIASAVCDLWANESVHNVKLFGGQAPEVFTEMLIYDCRLMNTANNLHESRLLKRMLVESDRYGDPQALFLDPEVCFGLAKLIVSETDDYHRTLKAANYACDAMQQAVDRKLLHLGDAELKWLHSMKKEIDGVPESVEGLWAEIHERCGHLFSPDEYGLEQDLHSHR